MRATIAVTALLLCTIPTLADWQWTKWGMTNEEFMAALPSTVTDARGLMPYEASGITFGAAPMIFEKGLERITLMPSDPADCQGTALRNMLQATYGAGAGDTWRDVGNGNLVRLKDAGESYCTITYEPLPSGNAPGGL